VLDVFVTLHGGRHALDLAVNRILVKPRRKTREHRVVVVVAAAVAAVSGVVSRHVSLVARNAMNIAIVIAMVIAIVIAVAVAVAVVFVHVFVCVVCAAAAVVLVLILRERLARERPALVEVCRRLRRGARRGCGGVLVRR
jgi:hypothetical protein